MGLKTSTSLEVGGLRDVQPFDGPLHHLQGPGQVGFRPQQAGQALEDHPAGQHRLGGRGDGGQHLRPLAGIVVELLQGLLQLVGVEPEGEEIDPLPALVHVLGEDAHPRVSLERVEKSLLLYQVPALLFRRLTPGRFQSHPIINIIFVVYHANTFEEVVP